jgi:hypothetical protein
MVRVKIAVTVPARDLNGFARLRALSTFLLERKLIGTREKMELQSATAYAVCVCALDE